ncbi:MAG: glutamate--tRNA ligase [Patescibacteria group bacterium]
MSETVVTRFAPSPTGNLHIGGARTALFNYLWAKKNNGKFILRIEDTDRTRYDAQSEQSIMEGLKWLGLSWDEGPIKQSDRFEIYKKYASQLVEQGKAYYCFCTPEHLDMMRQIQMQKNRAPRYDGSCRKLTTSEIQEKLNNNKKFVIRLKVPEQGMIIINDLVRGEINFQCADVDDQVLIKSDGFPTYHLANVVDDHEMGITHVIRGEEWIPSTPKHILLYQAFGWQPPQFAHLSLFINKGGGKMSKREGAVSLLNYRDQGYLPEAVNNFMAFLGWNPKNEKEFFNLTELISEFDLHKIHKANPIFDIQKLDFYNGYYLRKKNIDEFYDLAKPYLNSEYTRDEKYIKQILSLEQERVKKLTDLNDMIGYFFTDSLQYDKTMLIWKKEAPEKIKDNLIKLATALQKINESDWYKEKIESTILNWIQQNNYSNGEILWPMRVSLTGLKASPSPFEVSSVLKKEKSIARIQTAINLL